MNEKTDLRGLTQAGLVRFVEGLGQPAFRGRQLLPWLYRPGPIDFADMSDLAKPFRALLSERARIGRLEPAAVQRSQDGVVKFAFRLEDGRVIESVLIPEEDRGTLCLSTQAGCAMGCVFCRTGAMGFGRNLTVSEIVNQVVAVRDWALAQSAPPPLSNLVFMGMGEPLANMAALLDSLSILTEQRGLDFSNRRITVSTCGLIGPMLELGEKTDVNLAISLHAADDETRSRLMPVNRTQPLAALIEAAAKYRQKRRKRVMFEYTLLAGVNDSDNDAKKLAKLLRPVRCKINLLAVNAAGGEFESPGMERILAFQKTLRDAGYTVFIRQSRGADIAAACGQLAGELGGCRGLTISTQFPQEEQPCHLCRNRE